MVVGTVRKRIVGIGRFSDPEDSAKPCYVALHWFDGKPPVIQPCSEAYLFNLLNGIFKECEVTVQASLHLRR